MSTIKANNVSAADPNTDLTLSGSGTGKVVISSEISGPAYQGPTTDNDLSFAMTAGNNFSCTAAGAGTLTFTGITSGQSGNVFLNNSGGHAISLAATTKGDANLATTISTAGTYWLTYFSPDGTNVYVTTSAAFA